MKVGFALSGGGARGIAHLGVVKALAELGIRPAMISGTSSGAILGTFLAAGLTPEKILQYIQENKVISSLKLAMSRTGLLRMDAAIKLYSSYLGVNTFEELKIPLVICATDLVKAETVFFDKGDLFLPMQAASSIPLLFKPLPFRGMLLVDGGLVNNLPVEPLLDSCDIIVGIHSNPIGTNDQLGSFRKVMERCFHLAVRNTIATRRVQCDIFIEPPGLSSFRVFDVSKAEQIFEIGYTHTMNMQAELRGYFETLKASREG
jgi:NTE family protein